MPSLELRSESESYSVTYLLGDLRQVSSFLRLSFLGSVLKKIVSMSCSVWEAGAMDIVGALERVIVTNLFCVYTPVT